MKTTLFLFLTLFLHTACLEKYALTLRNYIGENSSFLHTFLIFCFESKKNF